MFKLIYRFLTNPAILPGQTWRIDGMGLIKIVWTESYNHFECAGYYKFDEGFDKIYVAKRLSLRCSGTVVDI